MIPVIANTECRMIRSMYGDFDLARDGITATVIAPTFTNPDYLMGARYDLIATHQLYRTFLYFDLRGIDPGESIEGDLELSFYVYISDGGQPIEIHIVEGLQSSPSVVAADFAAQNANMVSLGHEHCDVLTAGGRRKITFTDAGKALVQSKFGGELKLCLLEEWDRDDREKVGVGSYGIYLYMTQQGSGFEPQLNLETVPPKLYVELNAIDISDHILAARTERGWDEELQQASSGIAELICDNQNGDFSPENVDGVYYGDLELGALIQVYEKYGGTTYYHFTGKISKLTPHGEKENLIAYIVALDGMDDLAELEINTQLRTNTETGTLVGDILDAAAWPAGARVIDGGIDTLQLGWFHKIKALVGIRICEAIELGRFHVTPTGDARWENRHARLTGSGLVSQHDFEDTAVELAYEWSKRLVYNQVIVRGRRYFIGGIQLISGYDMGTIDDELIWSAHTGDTGAPFVSKQGSLVLWAEFGSPLQSSDSLVKGTHWNANTEPDKTGTDVSDNITLVQTEYGQSVKLEFSNSGAQGAYLVEPDSPPEGAPEDRTVLVYGVLYSVEVMAIEEEDTTSQDKYGKRGLPLDVPFKSNPNEIQAQAQFLLSKYKDAVPRAISVKHIARTGWPGHTIRLQCLERDISDRITLKSTKLAVDTDYYINKVIQDYIFQEAGMVHETTWVVERALGTAEGVFWLLGLVDFGELGEATRLGI